MTLVWPDQCEQALERLLALYKARWETQPKEFYHFLESFIARPNEDISIETDILCVDAKDVVVMLHLRYRNTLYMYLMAADTEFSPHISIGNVLIGLCLERAIVQRCGIYDFLKGSEEYKFHWANTGRRCLSVRVYQRRVGPIAELIGRSAKAIGKVLLR